MRFNYPVPEGHQKNITQTFGEHPDWYATFGLAGHNGIDFGIPLNSPVYACSIGTVEKIGFDAGGYGNYIKIRHAWGVSIYAHLSSALVHTNQTVEALQVIGRSGSTGNSTGPHLHFEIRLDDEPKNNGYNGAVDPMQYLEADLKPVQIELKPELYRVTGGVYVRSEPSIESGMNTVIGNLPAGLVVQVQAVTKGWANLGNGMYCAVVYDGVEYMRKE